MKVHVELCVIPIGTGTSVGEYIAECQRVIAGFGLHSELHAYGTNIEGEWDTVMAAVKSCHERLHAMGAPRLHSQLKIGTRTDREQSLSDKVSSVQVRLSE